MTSPARLLAPVLLAVVGFIAAGSADAAVMPVRDVTGTSVAAASDTTTTTTSVPPPPLTSGAVVSSPNGTTAPTTIPGTTTTTIAGVPVTTTTAAPPTTVDPVQLTALIQSLDGDLARIQAVNSYLAARTAASQPATGHAAASAADTALVDAAAAELRATAVRDASAQRYNDARHRLAEVALTLYMDAGAPPDGAPATLDDVHRSAMLGMVLMDEKTQLEMAKQDLAHTTADFVRTQHDADQLVEAHAAAMQAAAQTAAMIAVTASAPSPTKSGPASARSRLASALPLAVQALSPTILGPTMLSAAELVGWYGASGHQPHLTVPLPILVDSYESLGAVDGVRADIAFAQSVLETGYFGFPGSGQLIAADNNFAGIGACDSCTTGRSFPDANTGVAAQLQLLHGYATPQPLAGPMTAPAWVTGCCRTWMDLTGVWATAPDYGYRILKIYRSMVEWALTSRSTSAGL